MLSPLYSLLFLPAEFFLLMLLTFSIFEHILKSKILDNREWEVSLVARPKFQTLTDQMFYTLLCLNEECCGMDILDKVPAMTKGRVHVGSGTLYTLLEQFLDAEMICETKVEGRRRSYILTNKGKAMLENEYARLNAQLADYRLVFGKKEELE